MDNELYHFVIGKYVSNNEWAMFEEWGLWEMLDMTNLPFFFFNYFYWEVLWLPMSWLQHRSLRIIVDVRAETNFLSQTSARKWISTNKHKKFNNHIEAVSAITTSRSPTQLNTTVKYFKPCHMSKDKLSTSAAQQTSVHVMEGGGGKGSRTWKGGDKEGEGGSYCGGQDSVGVNSSAQLQSPLLSAGIH